MKTLHQQAAIFYNEWSKSNKSNNFSEARNSVDFASDFAYKKLKEQSDNNKKWISVNDNLPDYDVFVLWVREDGFQFIAEIDHDNDWENFSKTFENDGWTYDDHCFAAKITHWMPLPEPPSN